LFEKFEILIEDLTSEGDGVGRMDGLAVFIPGTLPGDLARIKLIDRKKNFARGEVVGIVKPSAHRISPKCHAHAECGGCCLQGYDYQAQLDLKKRRITNALQRIGGLDMANITINDVIGMDNPYYYRNKAVFHVSSKDGKPLIGFYSSRTHDLVDVTDCNIQNSAASSVTSAVRAYIEETGAEGITCILVRTAAATGEIMVRLTTNGSGLPHPTLLIEKLENTGKLVSVTAVDGEKVVLSWGKSFITDFIGGLKFRISAESFFQVNPAQTRVLYDTVAELAGLTGVETVIDFYCGAGTITLFLAKNAKKVIGIESNPRAANDARTNARINNIKNAEFIESDVLKIDFEQLTRPDVVILDPPRKGAGLPLVEKIASLEPEKIIYVSCDPATLARDTKAFAALGYIITAVQPVDMFPMTNHIEAIALLQKKLL